MPIPNVSTRVVCGIFCGIFHNFMQKRVDKVINARTFSLKVSWPLNFVRSVLLLTACTVLCCFVNNSAILSSKHADEMEVFQPNSFTNVCLHSIDGSFYMLATVCFLRTTFRRRNVRYKISISISPVLVLNSGVMIVALIYLSHYLLACGDIESNPGPGPERNKKNVSLGNSNQCHLEPEQTSRSSTLDRMQAELSSALSQAVNRLESVSYQQGNSIEKQINGLEGRLNHRLQQIEDVHAKLAQGLDSLHHQCNSLWHENRQLRSDLTMLTEKCDYLENQSRRDNLLFFGFDSASINLNSWDECENKVREVIKRGIGIDEEMLIERAHRVGKAVVVKFNSYKQKSLVLSRSHQLKQSGEFSYIYINEDFSEIVQKKRKGLIPVQRELRQKGRIASLRFDKLISDHEIFTYDLANNEIQRRERRSNKKQSIQYDARRHQLSQSGNQSGWPTLGEDQAQRQTWNRQLSSPARHSSNEHSAMRGKSRKEQRQENPTYNACHNHSEATQQSSSEPVSKDKPVQDVGCLVTGKGDITSDKRKRHMTYNLRNQRNSESKNCNASTHLLSDIHSPSSLSENCDDDWALPSGSNINQGTERSRASTSQPRIDSMFQLQSQDDEPRGQPNTTGRTSVDGMPTLDTSLEEDVDVNT